MRKSFWAVTVLGVALGSLSLYLAYQLLDAGISVTYAYDQQTYLKRDRAVLRELALDLAKGAKREDIVGFLSSKYGTNYFVKEEGLVVADGVAFRFRGDALADILLDGETESQTR